MNKKRDLVSDKLQFLMKEFYLTDEMFSDIYQMELLSKGVENEIINEKTLQRYRSGKYDDYINKKRKQFLQKSIIRLFDVLGVDYERIEKEKYFTRKLKVLKMIQYKKEFVSKEQVLKMIKKRREFLEQVQETLSQVIEDIRIEEFVSKEQVLEMIKKKMKFSTQQQELKKIIKEILSQIIEDILMKKNVSKEQALEMIKKKMEFLTQQQELRKISKEIPLKIIEDIFEEYCECYDNDSYEKELLINQECEDNLYVESIISQYNNMNIIDRYKVLTFYDDYEKITEDAWSLIHCYDWLNNNGKIEIRNYIFSKSIEEPCRLNINCLSKSDSMLLSEIYNKKNTTDDVEIHKSLVDNLIKKITHEKTCYLALLNEEITQLPRLELIDWQLIEYYYSLEYIEQQQILNKCDELIENCKYSEVVK